MKSLKGSQTELNLLKSFAGESQARNRYDYFSKAAKKEGYVEIAKLFAETALQEQQHAKRFFKFLEGGAVEITATYPAGMIGSTVDNLKAAAGGENEEWTEIYPSFAKVAREEGYEVVAKLYEAICVAEELHEKRYRVMLASLEDGSVFKQSAPVKWVCSNCGFVHEGDEAPGVCVCCAHPQAYFEVLEERYV